MSEIFVHLFNDFNTKKRRFWFQMSFVVQKILRILYRTLFIYKSIEAGIKFYLIPVMIVQLIIYVDIKRFEWDNFISVYKYNIYF